MCILLKLDYAKLGVSNFFSKVIEEKPLGGSARAPLLVKEGLMCSHDPIFGTNKNRILKNGSFERTFT